MTFIALIIILCITCCYFDSIKGICKKVFKRKPKVSVIKKSPTKREMLYSVCLQDQVSIHVIKGDYAEIVDDDDDYVFNISIYLHGQSVAKYKNATWFRIEQEINKDKTIIT